MTFIIIIINYSTTNNCMNGLYRIIRSHKHLFVILVNFISFHNLNTHHLDKQIVFEECYEGRRVSWAFVFDFVGNG